MLCRMLNRSSCCASLVNTGRPSAATRANTPREIWKLGILDRALIDAARRAKRQPVSGSLASVRQHYESALGAHGGDHLVHDAAEHLVQIQGGVEGLRQAHQKRQAFSRGIGRFGVGHGASALSLDRFAMCL